MKVFNYILLIIVGGIFIWAISDLISSGRLIQTVSEYKEVNGPLTVKMIDDGSIIHPYRTTSGWAYEKGDTLIMHLNMESYIVEVVSEGSKLPPLCDGCFLGVVQ